MSDEWGVTSGESRANAVLRLEIWEEACREALTPAGGVGQAGQHGLNGDRVDGARAGRADDGDMVAERPPNGWVGGAVDGDGGDGQGGGEMGHARVVADVDVHAGEVLGGAKQVGLGEDGFALGG